MDMRMPLEPAWWSQLELMKGRFVTRLVSARELDRRKDCPLQFLRAYEAFYLLQVY
jgi:hypothetical protein